MKCLAALRYSTKLNTLAWKAEVLPLHNARVARCRYSDLVLSSGRVTDTDAEARIENSLRMTRKGGRQTDAVLT